MLIPPDQAAQVKSPAHWNSVKIALIKSIRAGVFFDRKYWARYSTSGDVLKPIYFSSTIMNDKAEHVRMCTSECVFCNPEALNVPEVVKYLIGLNTPTSDLRGDVNVESDCDGEPWGLGEESQQTERGKEEQIRAVLTIGSFSACATFHPPFFSVKNDRISSWKYLFFYRCTDEISFAPLKSQGVDSRLKYIRENTVEAAPPPCSPKSIYVLAYLVRRTSTSTLCMILTCQFQLEIKPLSDSVLADMRSNVASYGAGDNVDSLVTAA